MKNWSTQYDALVDWVVKMIKTYISWVEGRTRKVIDFQHPEALKLLFDFTVTKEWENDEAILKAIQWVLDHSVATMHPRYFNQLYAGANIYSILAEWIVAVLNTSMATYEISPLFTLMEEYIFERMAWLVERKWNFDGLMLPWWSSSNMYAMQMARYALDPEINEIWLYNSKKLYILTSEESHYSITKSAMLMWHWKKSVVKIKTNNDWVMNVDDLEQKIIEIRNSGDEVMMINATLWTTVLWAYDDLNLINSVWKKYDIRVHVDMIRWWTVMFDNDLKKKIDGIQEVDSFAWNAHKMMWANQQCSVWMTQRSDISKNCNTLKTQYLFNDDKWYGVGYDTWDKYTQCGRRVDVLKLWLMRKSLGDTWIWDIVRKAFSNSTYLVDQIKKSKNLYLYQEPQSTNVCFWYIPQQLTLPNTNHEDNLAYIMKHHDVIHPLTSRIKDLMLRKWQIMTTYTHIKWFPNFFRMICISPKVDHQDLDFVVSHIQELGRNCE